MTTTIVLHEDGSVTASDAAKLLGVTYRTVNSWITQRDDPLPTKFLAQGKGGKGGATRVSIADVIAWKEARAADKAAGQDFEDDDDQDDGEASPDGSPTKRVRYNLEKSKAKRAHHLAMIEEMNEMARRYSLLPVDMIIQITEEDRANIKAGILNLPGRLATRMVPLTDQKACYDEIRKECLDLLQTLKSGYDIASEAVENIKVERGQAAPDDGDEA
ncbi:Helix-turn-helix domain protein [Paracoccus haematequi]|uniref:Helix-turn-helix domain protein n=1 Tax=Paracoccus haematequi TaxID=2491866 RepID=A0A447IRD8_9RHOB|nr:hypothetical protein [Paracoccus haematequi]VDS10055.1 Helix-turn-helix domain protein [Paracoccus haematequi]